MTKVFSVSLLACVTASVLSGCGNKGELFLVPDQMTQQELERLEQSLGGAPAPAIPPGSEGNNATDSEDDIEGSKKVPSKSRSGALEPGNPD